MRNMLHMYVGVLTFLVCLGMRAWLPDLSKVYNTTYSYRVLPARYIFAQLSQSHVLHMHVMHYHNVLPVQSGDHGMHDHGIACSTDADDGSWLTSVRSSML